MLAPEQDVFRLGVQKCRKTIQNGVGNGDIFQIEGLKQILKNWRDCAKGDSI